MKPRATRGTFLAMLFMASALTVSAHPGHDGHELTWDFAHLVDHPTATLGWAGLLAGLSWTVWLLLRRAATQRVYNLRGSQPSRGK